MPHLSVNVSVFKIGSKRTARNKSHGGLIIIHFSNLTNVYSLWVFSNQKGRVSTNINLKLRPVWSFSGWHIRRFQERMTEGTEISDQKGPIHAADMRSGLTANTTLWEWTGFRWESNIDYWAFHLKNKISIMLDNF